jgi:hypothetical protein
MLYSIYIVRFSFTYLAVRGEEIALSKPASSNLLFIKGLSISSLEHAIIRGFSSFNKWWIDDEFSL